MQQIMRHHCSIAVTLKIFHSEIKDFCRVALSQDRLNKKILWKNLFGSKILLDGKLLFFLGDEAHSRSNW